MPYTLIPDHDPKARVIKSPDPTDKDCWPKAPSKFVFIFDAINLAGSVLFKDEWTGGELAVVHWARSPKDQRAYDRLPKPIGGGAGGSRVYGKAIARPKHPPFAHILDWHAEQRQPLWEENGRALNRLKQAVEWLAQRCRDGELKSFARPAGGGEVMPMRANEWIIDSPLERFVEKGGSRRRFLLNGHVSPEMDSFAFFDRANLQEVLARQPDAPLIIGQADLSRLSPYLRLAVRVALERGYFGKQFCETKDVREAEVGAAWPDLVTDIEVVPSMVTAIARVINFPDAKAINTGRQGRLRRKTGATRKA